THCVPGGAKLRAAIYHSRTGADVLGEVESFFANRAGENSPAGPGTEMSPEDETQGFPEAALICD
ncbi:MAG: tRNA-dihydrouridine synthase, partial [Terracidiphilus sp.]